MIQRTTRRHCEQLCSKFQRALALIAKPWNGLIIAVLDEGARRFGEIQDLIPGIGDRMLAERLKELEAHGVLERRVLPGPPVRVEYELTRIGRGFGAVADAIGAWGEQLAEVGTAKANGGAQHAVARAASSRAAARTRRKKPASAARSRS